MLKSAEHVLRVGRPNGRPRASNDRRRDSPRSDHRRVRLDLEILQQGSSLFEPRGQRMAVVGAAGEGAGTDDQTALVRNLKAGLSPNFS